MPQISTAPTTTLFNRPASFPRHEYTVTLYSPEHCCLVVQPLLMHCSCLLPLLWPLSVSGPPHLCLSCQNRLSSFGHPVCTDYPLAYENPRQLKRIMGQQWNVITIQYSKETYRAVFRAKSEFGCRVVQLNHNWPIQWFILSKVRRGVGQFWNFVFCWLQQQLAE